MKTSRWPISHLPISGVTPFTYRDGETYLSMLNRLAQYVTEQLHPNLRETVEHMVEEMEHILAAQHSKYVEGIQDFQRIHDAFMTDVNSALTALNDTAAADLVNDPGSIFGTALREVFAAIFRDAIIQRTVESTGVLNPVDYGADPTGDTDSTVAFQQAIADVKPGGTVWVPPGVYSLSDTLVIDKPFDFDCGRGGAVTAHRGTVLQFAPGVSGIRVRHDSHGVPPSGWRIGPLVLESRSTQAGDDVGVLATGGPGTLDGLSVEKFGSHGIALIGGSNTIYTPSNVNNCLLLSVRAARNRGDGIFIHGSDSQVHLLLKPGVTANHGWGINIDRASSNYVLKPHANQTYHGSPGAYRDNAMSSTWDGVYSEGTAPFVIEDRSKYIKLSTSLYGKPVVVDRSTGDNVSWYDTVDGHYKSLSITGEHGTTQKFDVDMASAGGAGIHRWRQSTPNSKIILQFNDSTDVLHTDADSFAFGRKALSPIITSGEGDPNGVVRAGKGSLYMRTDGGLDIPALYVKSTNGGTANWVEK